MKPPSSLSMLMIYIASSTTQALTKFKEDLSTHFDLKVLGVPSKLLGIQLEWGNNFKSVSMNCSSLIKDLLIDHNMTNCTPEPIPMKADFRTRKADCPTQDQQKQQEFIKLKAKYQQLVGSFYLYAIHVAPISAMQQINYVD